MAILKKKKLIIIICIVIAVILLFSLGAIAGKKDVNTSVQTVKLQKQDIESHIIAEGQIMSMDKREVISDVEEKIEKVLVKKGDKVKKGQVLIKLDETDIRYKIDEAQMRLNIEKDSLEQLKRDLETSMKNAEILYDDAKTTYENNKKLYEENAISKTAFDKCKNDLDTLYNDYISAKNKLGSSSDISVQQKKIKLSELEIEKLKDDLERHTIKSPITGTIVDMEISESGIVESYVTLLFIQDVDHLEIITNVNEYDASKIAIGDCVKITGDAFEGKEYTGEVSYIEGIAKKIETGQGKENAVEIKINVKDVDEYLKPGFSAKLDILTDSEKEVFVVPFETIFTKKNGEKVIYTVDNGVVKEHVIDTGIESDLAVEVIADDLKENSDVIISPNEHIKDGDNVMTENKVM